MTQPTPSPTGALWARFRFSVVGSLLSSPPARGTLQAAIRSLAEQDLVASCNRTRCPLLRRDHRTLVLHRAPRARRPSRRLRRAVRKDRGKISLAAALAEQLHLQYRDHPDWSYQLHYDNLAALVKADPSLGRLPLIPRSSAYMQAHGCAQPRLRPADALARSRQNKGARRVRSAATKPTYVGALWHLDFHHGSIKVLTAGGQWLRPLALGVLDDHSRLCCHVQWYLSETAEDLVHGLSQAIQKRGLPRVSIDRSQEVSHFRSQN